MDTNSVPLDHRSILIVDDHAVCRDGIEWLARGHLNATLTFEHAGDGETAIIHALKTRFDVIFLDLNLPKLSGLEVLRQLNLADCAAKTIALTQCEDANLLDEVLRLGVDALVLKDSDAQEVKSALDAILGGNRYVDPRVAALLAKSKDDPPKTPLTKREHEVIELVARGLTNKEISTLLACSEETVKSHRANGMRKLKAKNSPELVAKFYAHMLSRGSKAS